MTHSPGPWSIHDDGLIRDANAQWIATALNVEDDRLITAAPDLLEACRLVAPILEWALNGGSDPRVVQLRAAIAKAEAAS